MSNLFNNNNRFSSLMDDFSIKENTHDKMKYNDDINKKKFYKRENFYSRQNNEKNQKTQFYEEKIRNKKKIDLNNNLKLENFPELINKDKANKSVNNHSKENITFLEKLKFDNTPKIDSINNDNNDNNVEPGWVLLKKEKGTNKTIVKYGTQKEPTLQNFNVNILNTLVDINEKHKKEYIYLWGEDEYEKMFLFLNYDYNYFNKLDELYEEEIENRYQEELEEEKLNDYVNSMHFEYY